MKDVPHLITFAPMIDSETWRLLLDHYSIDYEEHPHAFIWGSALALHRAGSVQVPALSGCGLRLVGPASAIDRWDAAQPPGHALIPPDPAMRAIALSDWASFNGTLAKYTAQLAYYHLLPHRELMLEPFTRGIPAAEARVTHVIYPVQRALLSLLLQLTSKTMEVALAGIRHTFDRTDARVNDGRPFLQGARLTLGDLALAAAAAPVLLPGGCRSPIPASADLPPAFASVVDEMRERPTGRFVERFYRSAVEARRAAKT